MPVNREKIVSSVASSAFPRIISPVPSWNTLVLKSMNRNDRGIWKQILTLASGKPLPSIMCTTRTRPRRASTKIQQSRPSGLSSKVTMLPFLHMARLVLARPTPWRASSTQQVTPSVVSCPGQWRRFSASSRCSPHKTRLLWSVQVTYRSTMR